MGSGGMRIITWQDMHKIGRSDNARRWFPNPDIAEYFDSLRPPSRVWPHSYAKAAQTAKFSRWLLDNRPAIAQQLGITNEESAK